MDTEINLLCDRQDFIPVLVEHIWNEWKHDFINLTDYKTPEALYNFYRSTSGIQIPTAYVMHKNDTFIGTCLVDNEDMQLYPDRRPWLASVYIAPEFRNKGYASLLINYVAPKYPLLHLWTFNQQLADLYKRFGFEEKEVISEHGCHKNIIYMSRQTT
jgi:GNAT superfamily N-acetyltransferase